MSSSAIGALIGLLMTYDKLSSIHLEAERKREAEERENNRRIEEEAERKRLKKELFDLQQSKLKSEVLYCKYEALKTLKRMSSLIISANQRLDQAEYSFNHGAASPFWSHIESALKDLGEYNASVRNVKSLIQKYHEKHKQIVGQFVPMGLALPDRSNVKSALIRLDQVVWRGHTGTDAFKIVYEQRRTTKAVIDGFANLESAINNMSRRLENSIETLYTSLDNSIKQASDNQIEAMGIIQEISYEAHKEQSDSIKRSIEINEENEDRRHKERMDSESMKERARAADVVKAAHIIKYVKGKRPLTKDEIQTLLRAGHKP